MPITSPLPAQGSGPAMSRSLRRSAARLRSLRLGGIPVLGRGLEGQRAGVDAVPVAGLRGTVVEDMAQVTAAVAADDLGAPHEQAVVRPQLDRLGDRGLVEAGPPRARVELGVGAEQLAPAAGAPVEAIGVVVDVLTGERPLGVRLTQHAVLQ